MPMRKRLVSFAVFVSCVAGVTAIAEQQIRPRVLGIGPYANADAFFDDSVVHEIRLVVNSKDWQALKDHFMDNTYYPCDFRWRDQTVRNIGIRSRGTGSRSGVKPALRVDFDRYTTDQKFLGLKSVILRNSTQDASNLHERLSMALFRRLGLEAPREAHTTLFVNNDYVGLYEIVESIDKPFLKRTYDQDEGYLYEYDYPPGNAPYYLEYRGSDPGLYVPAPFKPETHEDNPRPEYIEQFIWTVNLAGDAVFRSAMSEYLDLLRFIRHVAVEVFVADNDGFLGDWGVNNFYFHRFDNQKLFTFIAWDKSEAFKSGYSYGIFHNLADVPAERQNRLMRRLLSYPDLYEAYLDALLECARSAGEPAEGASGGPGWLEREVEREYGQIHAAAIADPFKPFTNDEFERAISDLRTFASHRVDAVTRQVGGSRARGVPTTSYRHWSLPRSRND